MVFRGLSGRERSRTTPGSGLGLSMVAAIADLHGAMVKLGDNGPGLVVSITFDAMGPTFDPSWPVMTIGRQGAQVPTG